MFKSVLTLLLLFPLTTFAQTLNLVGDWHVESTQTSSAKKITSLLIKDVLVKREHDLVELYQFNEDGSFSHGSTGLFSASSGAGNWILENDNQLVLNFAVGEKFLKRTFTVEKLGSEKIKLTER